MAPPINKNKYHSQKLKQPHRKQRRTMSSNDQVTEYGKSLIEYVQSTSGMPESCIVKEVEDITKNKLTELKVGDTQTLRDTKHYIDISSTTSSSHIIYESCRETFHEDQEGTISSAKPKFYNTQMLEAMNVEIVGLPERDSDRSSEIYCEFQTKNVEDRKQLHKLFFDMDSESSSSLIKLKQGRKLKKDRKKKKSKTATRKISRRNRRSDTDNINYQELLCVDDDVTETEESPSVNKNMSKETIYICDFCQKTFKSKTSHSDHVRIHTGDGLRCDKCGETFVTNVEFKRHEKTHAVEELTYKCEICDKIFLNTTDLEWHGLDHKSGTQRFECEVCLRTFGRKKSLLGHMKMHLNKEK